LEKIRKDKGSFPIFVFLAAQGSDGVFLKMCKRENDTAYTFYLQNTSSDFVMFGIPVFSFPERKKNW